MLWLTAAIPHIHLSSFSSGAGHDGADHYISCHGGFVGFV